MLNAIIRFSLHNRVLVIAMAMFLLVYGGWQADHLAIDVFPNLNRPRVVIRIRDAMPDSTGVTRIRYSG